MDESPRIQISNPTIEDYDFPVSGKIGPEGTVETDVSFAATVASVVEAAVGIYTFLKRFLQRNGYTPGPPKLEENFIPVDGKPYMDLDSADLLGSPFIDNRLIFEGIDIPIEQPMDHGKDKSIFLLSEPYAEAKLKSWNNELTKKNYVTGPGPTSKGDPVDSFSGAFVIEEIDLSIPNEPIPLFFSRYYRSAAGYKTKLGWNWDHNHNQYLRVLSGDPFFPDGSVAKWTGKLREQVFKAEGSAYVAPIGVFESLEKHPIDLEYLVKSEGGVSHRYNVYDPITNRLYLKEISDRYGNKLVYDYDYIETELVLISVTSSSTGRKLNIGYGDCLFLESVFDLPQRKVRYFHDLDVEHLIRVYLPNTADFEEGPVTFYDYGVELFGLDMLVHNIVRVADGKGKVYVQNEYYEDIYSYEFARVRKQYFGTQVFQFLYSQLQVVEPKSEYINAYASQTQVMNPDRTVDVFSFNFQGNLLEWNRRRVKDKTYRAITTKHRYWGTGNIKSTTLPQSISTLPPRTSVDYEYPDPLTTDIRAWGLLTRVIQNNENPPPPGTPPPDYIPFRVLFEAEYTTLPNQLIAWSRSEYPYDATSTDKTLFETTYTYDSNVFLEDIVTPEVRLPDYSLQTAAVHHFTEDSTWAGRVASITSPEGKVTKLTYGSSDQAKARVTEVAYDQTGLNLIETIEYESLTESSYGLPLNRIDFSGETWKTKYNKIYQLEEFEAPSIDGLRGTRGFQYDSSGLPVGVSTPKGDYVDPLVTGNSLYSVYKRGIQGYISEITEAAGSSASRVTRRSHSYDGHLAWQQNPLRETTHFVVDERGLLLETYIRGIDKSLSEIRRFRYSDNGLLVKSYLKNGAGEYAATEYEYDGFFRLSRIIFPNGSELTREYAWSVPGDPTSSYYHGVADFDPLIIDRLADSTGHILSISIDEFDKRGRHIIRRVRDFRNTYNEVGSQFIEAKFYFDKDNNLVKVEDARASATTIQYDGLNRPTKIVDPETNEQLIAYDDLNRTREITVKDLQPDTTFKSRVYKETFDARGRLVLLTEPNSIETDYEYDDRDLLVQSSLPHAVGATSAVTNFSYGAFGELLDSTFDPAGLNIINTWEYDAGIRLKHFIDPTNQTTSYSYDPVGRSKRTSYPSGDWNEAQYNGLGQLTSRITSFGSTVSYGYNTAGQLSTFSASSGSGGIIAVPTHTFGYDGAGRIISAEVSGGVSTTRKYDGLSRLIEESTYGTTLSQEYKTTLGTIKRIWDANRTEELASNKNGFVTDVVRKISGGGPVLIQGIVNNLIPYGPELVGEGLIGSMVMEAKYDDRRRVKSLEYKVGAISLEKLDYRYDVQNRRRIENRQSSDSGFVSLSYNTQDSRERLTGYWKNASTFPGLSSGQNQTDENGDIAAYAAQATGAATYGYSYNAADDRLTAVNSVGTRTYDYLPGHRLEDSTLSGSTESASFADNGTMNGLGAKTFEVDALGRVTKIDAAPIIYDAFGRPSEIPQGTGGAGFARRLLYFGDELWQENNATTNTSFRQWTNHPSLGRCAWHTSSNQPRTLIRDANRTLLGTTDLTGFIQGRSSYEPFGSVISSTGPSDPEFGDLRYLPSQSLYLSRTRLLEPKHGLWLSRDSLGYQDSPSLYDYVGQSPANYVDPSGLKRNGGDEEKGEVAGAMFQTRSTIDGTTQPQLAQTPLGPFTPRYKYGLPVLYASEIIIVTGDIEPFTIPKVKPNFYFDWNSGQMIPLPGPVESAFLLSVGAYGPTKVFTDPTIYDINVTLQDIIQADFYYSQLYKHPSVQVNTLIGILASNSIGGFKAPSMTKPIPSSVFKGTPNGARKSLYVPLHYETGAELLKSQINEEVPNFSIQIAMDIKELAVRRMYYLFNRLPQHMQTYGSLKIMEKWENYGGVLRITREN